jgi:hypothetical protein
VATDKETLIVVRDKMRDLYKSVVSEQFLKALKEGKVVHFTLTLSKYEIWFEDKKTEYVPAEFHSKE